MDSDVTNLTYPLSYVTLEGVSSWQSFLCEMQCLGIPIDHRLRRLIREAQSVDTKQADSNHLLPLHDFGMSLTVDEHEYPISDLSFGLEMARPESKGGLLIALLRPHSTQNNSDGFLAGRRHCETLEAVSDLIAAVNNGKLGFDDISVFDAIPLIDEAATGPNLTTLIDDAQSVFADMVRAKNPDVVLCCFKTATQNTLVQQLSCRGVGKSFNDDKSVPTEPELSFTRVNAFHPSYAVNHYPIFCSLRRLLILEFTKAFACWRQKWIEEPWMESLRTECRQIPKKAAGGTSLYRLVLSCTNSCRVAKDKQSNWDLGYLKGRWEYLLASLNTSLEDCFLNSASDASSEEAYVRLKASGITWLCCDIAWMFEELDPDDTARLGIPRQLLCNFEAWCHKAWPKVKLQHNLTGSHGFYDHSELLLIKSTQPKTFAKRLENKFYNLLRDLNLSYEWSKDEALCETYNAFHRQIALGCAFRRFAAAFEDSLDELLDHTSSNEKPGFCRQFGSLSVN